MRTQILDEPFSQGEKEVVEAYFQAVDSCCSHGRSDDKVGSREGLENSLERISERLDRTIADARTEIERAEQEESGDYRLPLSMQDGLNRKQLIQEALRELDESDKKPFIPRSRRLAS